LPPLGGAGVLVGRGVGVAVGAAVGMTVGRGVGVAVAAAVGAAVGAGTLLAQKVLQDPIEQIFAYQYAVTGSWTDPHVERTGRQPASVVGPAAAAEGSNK